MDDEDDDGSDSIGLPALDRDIDELLETVIASDSAFVWQKGVQIEVGAKRWIPPAVSQDGGALLYVLLQIEIPRFVRDRLRLANSIAMRTVVALKLEALARQDILTLLVDVDAEVIVVDDYINDRRTTVRHVLAAVADLKVPLETSTRIAIGSTVWGRIEEGNSQEKGRRLEALLAFLFSQISEMKVVERNFRTETEEIDLVLQVEKFASRSWQKPGVPFLLVEAKNRKDKASQQMVSVLITKLQGKRGSTNIGILVSLAGFTEDAKMQELRFSTQDICIPMIDGPLLERLLTATDLDEEFETVIRQSLLR